MKFYDFTGTCTGKNETRDNYSVEWIFARNCEGTEQLQSGKGVEV